MDQVRELELLFVSELPFVWSWLFIVFELVRVWLISRVAAALTVVQRTLFNNKGPSSNSVNSSVCGVYHGDKRNSLMGNYCRKPGHTIERCYKRYGS